MTATRIETEESPRDNFTMIPNIVEDADIDPYAFRLYVHMRRVVGEKGGACWKNTQNLAEACHMSAGKVSQAKRTLEELGLIRIEKRAGPGGLSDFVTIVDVWRANHDYYAALKMRSQYEGIGESVHQVNANPECVHPMNALRSPGETKKIPLKKIHDVVEEDAPPLCESTSQSPEPETAQPDTVPSESVSLETPDSPAGAAPMPSEAPPSGAPDPVIAVVRLYEQEIGGMITPFVLDDIESLVADETSDPERWRAAFRASVGARNRWAYTKAVILHPERKPPASQQEEQHAGKRRDRGNGHDRRPGRYHGRASEPSAAEAERLRREAADELRELGVAPAD